MRRNLASLAGFLFFYVILYINVPKRAAVNACQLQKTRKELPIVKLRLNYVCVSTALLFAFALTACNSGAAPAQSTGAGGGLGQNLSVYQVQLDDVVYTLPCPMATLFAYGWELYSTNNEAVDPGSESIAAGAHLDYFARNNGHELFITVYNPATEENVIQVCQFAGASANLQDTATGTAMLLPGSIGMGSSGQDVEIAYGVPTVEYENIHGKIIEFEKDANSKVIISFDTNHFVVGLTIYSFGAVSPD